MSKKVHQGGGKDGKCLNQDLIQALQLFQAGHAEAARLHYHKTLKGNTIKLRKDPRNGGMLEDLAIYEYRHGNYAAMVEIMRKALQLKSVPEWHNKLGMALNVLGQWREAVKPLQQAIALDPKLVNAHFNLFLVHWSLGELTAAESCLRRAIALKPDFAEAHNALGSLLFLKQCQEEGIACLRRAAELEPGHASYFNTYLFYLNYLAHYPLQEVFTEHRRGAQRFERDDILPLQNMPDPDKRLHIGYISPDFKHHPVGNFMEAVLTAHRHEHVQVFCYSDVAHADDKTRQLKAQVPNWRNTAGMEHPKVAEMIRHDAIDILVDLAGITNDNRMPLFAQRAAPVQLSWIGYINTTGLKNMDYLLADDALIPVTTTQQFSETIYRMRGGCLCYTPPDFMPPVVPPPVTQTGYITFGSFNYAVKINREVITVWSEILRQVADARLVLKCKIFRFAEVRDLYRQLFAEQGIAVERVELREASPHRQMLEEYADIDIALDPFPYGGGATTTEALMMGVPVVTYSGPCYAGRISTSVLTSIGMETLTACDLDDYVQKAVALAGQAQQLCAMRETMRERIAGSTLGNPFMFIENLEAAYRDMWRRWCRSEGKG